MNAFTRSMPAAFIFLAIAINVAGCKTGQTQLSENFSLVSTWEDGRVMSVVGDTVSHRPGRDSTFVVTVQNGSAETWRDGYCLLLVDQAGIVSSLAEGTIDLVPQDGVRDSVKVTLPPQVEEGNYGLMLLIPGSGSLTATVMVGERRHQAGPRASASSCATGNLPDARYDTQREPFTGDLAPRPASGS